MLRRSSTARWRERDTDWVSRFFGWVFEWVDFLGHLCVSLTVAWPIAVEIRTSRDAGIVMSRERPAIKASSYG
jgi:hypothetical protein